MTGIPVEIFSGSIPLAASKLGQLITAPYDYDDAKALTMDVNNTAFNFWRPIVSKRFVVTGIYLEATSGVTQSANVEIYEGTSAEDTVVSKSIFQVEILKNDNRPLAPLNFLATEGVWINGKTDDNNIFATITGYYIPVVSS